MASESTSLYQRRHGDKASSPTLHESASFPERVVVLRWLSLGLCAVQNSAAALLMRRAKSQGADQPAWDTQLGVVLQEVLKILACLVLSAWDGSLPTLFANRAEALKTAVPAGLYLVQNNLCFLAVGYLDAPTCLVLYQLRILVTASLSVVLLQRVLRVPQWLALALLTVGVSLVVASELSSTKTASSTKPPPPAHVMIGVASILAACVSSGLAGVYFEKLLKTSQLTLWARNLQLAIYSSVLGVAGICLNAKSFSTSPTVWFQGYTTTVWVTLLNNALGGLLTAVVIRYADNIQKNFSSGLAIVLTSIASCVLFDSELGLLFFCGAACVVYAAFAYGSGAVLFFLAKVSSSSAVCACVFLLSC